MTYQSASGAGAQNMRELVVQMGEAHLAARSACSRIRRRRSSTSTAKSPASCAIRTFPTEHFGVPLAGSLIPWIDKDLGNGMSREEWKGGAGDEQDPRPRAGIGKSPIPVDSICVRIGAMRCHSQALTIKLRRDVPLAEIEVDARRRQRVGARDSQHREESVAAAHAGGRHRIAGGPDRPAAQARDGQATTSARSRWATSCSGAQPSRCGGWCASSSDADPGFRGISIAVRGLGCGV